MTPPTHERDPLCDKDAITIEFLHFGTARIVALVLRYDGASFQVVPAESATVSGHAGAV